MTDRREEEREANARIWEAVEEGRARMSVIEAKCHSIEELLNRQQTFCHAELSRWESVNQKLADHATTTGERWARIEEGLRTLTHRLDSWERTPMKVVTFLAALGALTAGAWAIVREWLKHQVGP